MSQKITVSVWGKDYEVSVHQRSKSVWIARGEYMGQPIEVQARTPTAAAALWRDTAQYRGNG